MDLFEKQAQLQSLFQTSPVDAAYAQGTVTGRRIAGTYQDLDIALLLLQRVNASEFFDYQVYFVSELSKTLEIEGLDVVILNQASLLQRAQIIRLREYTTLLSDLRPIQHTKFKADPKLYGLAQWYLQQAVELLFGTSGYLVTALALPKPEAYHDILDTIAKHGVIERALA